MAETIHDIVDGKFTPNLIVLASSICPKHHLASQIASLKGRDTAELKREYTQLIIKTNLHILKKPNALIPWDDVCTIMAYEMVLSVDKYNSVKYLLRNIALSYLYQDEAPEWLKEWWRRVEKHLGNKLSALKILLLFGLNSK